MEQYLEVTFTVRSDNSLNASNAFEIIAAILHEEAFESFEFLDDKLIGYTKEQVWDKESIAQILSSLPFAVLFDSAPVVNQNWNTLWEQQIKPIEIGNEIYIYPSFASPESNRSFQLVIDPKMAFGTGYHDTTRMMLEIMESIDFQGASVLDFGCGTGILAVYACMRGAAEVVGIDNDSIAIESAYEVAKSNQQQVTLRYQENDDYQSSDETYDYILANVNKNAIHANIEALLTNLDASRGEVLLSGLLLDDWDWVNQRMTTLGLKLVDKRASSAWLALRWKM